MDMRALMNLAMKSAPVVENDGEDPIDLINAAICNSTPLRNSKSSAPVKTKGPKGLMG